MKSIYKFYESTLYILIFILFVFPTFFSQNTSEVFSWNFDFIHLFYIILSVFICIFSYRYKIKPDTKKTNKTITKILFSFVSLILLICSYTILNSIAFAIDKIGTEKILINKPNGLLQWIFCIAQFFSLAFFEESIYRVYLADGLLHIFESNKIYIKIISEIFALICFSLGHLYMGIFSVLNAAIAYVILRALYKKTDSIIYSVVVHFIYNLLVLIFA